MFNPVALKLTKRVPHKTIKYEKLFYSVMNLMDGGAKNADTDDFL